MKYEINYLKFKKKMNMSLLIYDIFINKNIL